jgi:kinesin family protein 6/9
MGRSAVRVVVRMRPTDHYASNVIALLEDQKTVTVQTSRRGGLGAESAQTGIDSHAYKLDQVFPDASQEAVFDACAADIVKSVVAGYNGTVMAYGQTGAGKTYTMMGGTDYRTRGVVPRATKAIFDEISSQVDKQFEVKVSYIEVYNDRICDLLAPNSDVDVSIQEDAKGNITIRGATHTACTHEAEALSCLFTGNSNRAVAAHSLNTNSSRSHCIFTVHVTSRSRVESESASLIGKLHCVDLAGSERLSKTDSAGTLLREAQYINKSLTFLEQVVMALGTANRHVPFRQSKLTNILKDSLGGNSKTTMIANIWPEERHMEETISTLKFASRMMRVQTEASVNTLLDPETHIKQLQRKINDLKSELQMQNQLVGKSHIAYEGEIGEDERFEMEKTVKSYITGKVNDIEVRSLREVKEYFRIFKAFVDSKDIEARDADPRLAGSHQSQKESGLPPNNNALQKSASAAVAGRGPAEAGVGAVDQTSGQSVGIAAPAKQIRDVIRGPTSSMSVLSPSAPGPASNVGSPSKGAPGGDDDTEYLSPAAVPGGAAVPSNRNAAFAEYKSSEGAKLAQALREHQAQLQAKRKIAAELSAKVNEAKAVIDVTTQQMEQRRMDRQARGEDEVVDNEEFEIVKTVKVKKAEYRQLYDELSTTKTHRDHLVRLVDHAKQQLLSSFDIWYDRNFAAAGGGGGGGGDKPAAGNPAWRGGAAGRGRGGRSTGAVEAEDEDQLDEGERFELLELNRVMDEDPDSVAFYQARKQTQTAKASGAGTVAGAAFRRAKHLTSPPRRR